MTQASRIMGSILILGVIGAAMARAAVQGPAETSPSAAEPAKSVRVANVERRKLEHPIRASGTVRAKNELELGFLLSGEVSWVGVDVGSRVRRGQVLARLNRTQVAADAERARAATNKAKRDLARVTALHGSDVLPQATLDAATTAESIAVAQLRAAEFALQRGVLLAPDDGIIDARYADPGEVVGPGQPVLRMSGQSKGAVVRVALGERDVVGLDIGRGAIVTADVLDDVSFTAKVTQVASTASAGTGTFEVELRLDSASDRLKSGMTAKVEIQRVIQPGAVIPVAALAPADNGPASVVAIDNATARRIPVHVLFLEGTEVAIAEPLLGVTAIATEGSASLTDGQRVRAVAAAHEEGTRQR